MPKEETILKQSLGGEKYGETPGNGTAGTGCPGLHEQDPGLPLALAREVARE